MLNEKNLSECYDTLEIIWEEVYSQPSFDGQETQLDHINNAQLIVNGLLKKLYGVEKEWLPKGSFELPEGGLPES